MQTKKFMENKLLTIIIPTYNMEKYLQNCLDSLLVGEDLMSCLEVLVINDGSKDRSSEIAHRYEEKFPGIFKVIDKENGNYGSCINRGLKEATGKYVKILDADDSYITDAFSHFIEILQGIDVDLVINEVFAHDEEGNRLHGSKYSVPPRQVISFKEAYSKYSLYGMFMHVVTYKRDLLIKMGYRQTEGISYTDSEWALIPMLNVHTLYYFDEEVYSYLKGRAGQTMDPAVRRKCRHHSVIGIRTMVNSIISSSFDSIEKENYIYKVLLERIHLTYSDYLFDQDPDIDCSLLEDLDRFIVSNCPVLSTKMEALDISRFMKGYILKWRKSGYKTRFRFYKRIYHYYTWINSKFK